ncbi:MAG TPA: hypothetical protein VGI98_01355 [Candidatus Limnocylindrales bacterium]
MAIFASLFALAGRFVGRILTTTLGWASTLLFGQVPQSRQVWLAVLTFGSLVWVALVAGVVVPSVGTFLLGFVPVPDWIGPDLVRLAMLAGAVVLPPVLGAVTLLVTDPGDRPRGTAVAGTVLRGYPLAPALAITLVVLAVVGTGRRLDAAAHRRQAAHLALIVRPGRYDALVGAVRQSLEAEGLVTRRRPGSRLLTLPAQLLARIAGGGMERLVPDELSELVGPALVAAVYPSDLALTGSKAAVAEARALVVRDVDSTNAWFTTSKEAQSLEDRMAALAHRPSLDGPSLARLDGDLLRLTVPQEEWEVLYRRRLQLVARGEADLAGGSPGAPPAAPAAPTAGDATWSPGVLIGAAAASLVLLDAILLVTGFGRPRVVTWRSRFDRDVR